MLAGQHFTFMELIANLPVYSTSVMTKPEIESISCARRCFVMVGTCTTLHVHICTVSTRQSLATCNTVLSASSSSSCMQLQQLLCASDS